MNSKTWMAERKKRRNIGELLLTKCMDVKKYIRIRGKHCYNQNLGKEVNIWQQIKQQDWQHSGWSSKIGNKETFNWYLKCTWLVLYLCYWRKQEQSNVRIIQYKIPIENINMNNIQNCKKSRRSTGRIHRN